MTLSYAPFSLWFIPPIALAWFLQRLTKTESPWKSGWTFGLGWFGAGISWVHVSIADFGGLPLVGSLGLMFLLCAYLALFPAFFSYLLKRFSHPAQWLFVAPALWFLFEFLRSWLFTGFPWLSIGYSQIDGPLSGWMPVVGETGVSVVLMLISCSIALALNTRQYAHTAALLVIIYLSGWSLNQIDWVKPAEKATSVAMVQGNIKQELRWMPEQEGPTMQKYLKMTEPLWQNELIIWPEAAIPQLEPIAESYLLALDKRALEARTGLITGIVNYNFDTRKAFNNLIVLGQVRVDDTNAQYQYEHSNRYAKHHLLPIGEFIPFESWLRELAPIFDLPMSSFTRGEYTQPNLIANGYALAPALCFEIAFPRQLLSNLTEQTDFIVTVSNDAWFGRSHGPDQHMEIARVRAKEFGLPVLRATNTGITAFVDYRGNIQASLPQFEAAVVEADVFSTRGSTPYRTFGDLPMWIMCLSLLILACVRSRADRALH